MKLLKCSSCGSLVRVIDECNCASGITCCNCEMKEIKENSIDASFEKHLPQYRVIKDKIEVTIPHVMEKGHYIEFISYEHNNTIETVSFTYNDEAKTTFTYYPNSSLYSYCNKHSLWKTEVK